MSDTAPPRGDRPAEASAARQNGMAQRRALQRRITGCLFYLMVLSACGLVVFPFYWMFLTSIQPLEALFRFPPFLTPANPTFESYVAIFKERPLARWMWNSFVVSGTTTLLALLLGSIGGYSLARFRYRGKRAAELLILSTQMIPGVLLIIPIYVIFLKLGLLDTLSGLMVAYTTFSLPFCVWMLRSYFMGIPVELEESALVDGCTRLGALWRITLPLSLPALVATSMFAFVLAWDELIFAVALTNSQSVRVVSAGLAGFNSGYTIPTADLMAASTVSTLPVFLLFLFTQRYLLSGLTAGAVKG
ncbi:MAG TPA: carbohydrate ABC transporter permease [Candidatus Acidoferrum sp.]|nr:carbohydrate ABC transporter permease [Candidatus Acidoferrum sp.]